MTNELQYYIDIEDVLGIEYTCKCGSTAFQSISTDAVRGNIRCPICGKNLLPEGSDVDSVRELFVSIKDVQGRKESLKGIRLRIKAETR